MPGSTVRPALQKGEIEMGKINTSLAGKVAISPSVTRTEIIEEWVEEFEAAMDDESFRFNPMRRICEPEEIAAAIAFVSSPAGAFINGTNHVIDGGMSAMVPIDL